MHTYAMLQTETGDKLIVPSRKHMYHASPQAAERALNRLARRVGGPCRGYLWPTAEGNAMQDGNWTHITTIAL